jgi:hypothetical protein
MALFEKAVEGMLEGGAMTGVAVGAGVLFLAPGLLPAIGRALRPIAVGAIKTSMTVYNQTVSTVRETAENLVAEARAELEADAHHDTAEPTRRRGRAETQPG